MATSRKGSARIIATYMRHNASVEYLPRNIYIYLVFGHSFM